MRRDAVVLTVVVVLAGAVVAGGTLAVRWVSAGGTVVEINEPPPVLAVELHALPGDEPPQGLGAAEVVYVLPDENGESRFIAVYGSALPAEVGPVAPVRRGDAELLEQFGGVAVAHSRQGGKASALLGSRELKDLSPRHVPHAYERKAGVQPPLDLYLRPEALAFGDGLRDRPLFDVGPTRAEGERVEERGVRVGPVSMTFRWSDDDDGWVVLRRGEALETRGGDPLMAASVVRQDVRPRRIPGSTDAPIPLTFGQGEATVLRDGLQIPARWVRDWPRKPTRFATEQGSPLPLAEGAVWIVVVNR